MQDIYHFPGGDLDSSSTGDLRTATGCERTKQRILRRLLTNPGEYLFHPDFGAGLGRKVGETVKPVEWRTLIIGQMMLEEAVDRTPPPVVRLSLIVGGVSVSIVYTDAITGASEMLSFDVTR